MLASVAPNDACHFLGARFAKTGSVCSDGVCLNIGRAPDGSFSSVSKASAIVTCDAAVADVHTRTGDQLADLRVTFTAKTAHRQIGSARHRNSRIELLNFFSETVNLLAVGSEECLSLSITRKTRRS